jgi:hypothetical protein
LGPLSANHRKGQEVPVAIACDDPVAVPLSAHFELAM